MLPNVSAIYRDLAFMANPQSNRNYPTNEYSPGRENETNQKQLRHEQLMEKFRNAKKQSDYINSQLGQMNTYSNSPSMNGSLNDQYNVPYPYSYQQKTNYITNDYNSRPAKGWKPPNIRYRHIEDFKQPEILSIPRANEQQNHKNNNLDQEFYQEGSKEGRQLKQEKIGANKKDNSKDNQQQKPIKIDTSSESSYSRNWINRQSKFQDKLESYYELCRKRPASAKRQVQEVPTSKLKFTRGESKPYNGMQLEKAMKLLSFD